MKLFQLFFNIFVLLVLTAMGANQLKTELFPLTMMNTATTCSTLKEYHLHTETSPILNAIKPVFVEFYSSDKYAPYFCDGPSDGLGAANARFYAAFEETIAPWFDDKMENDFLARFAPFTIPMYRKVAQYVADKFESHKQAHLDHFPSDTALQAYEKFQAFVVDKANRFLQDAFDTCQAFKDSIVDKINRCLQDAYNNCQTFMDSVVEKANRFYHDVVHEFDSEDVNIADLTAERIRRFHGGFEDPDGEYEIVSSLSNKARFLQDSYNQCQTFKASIDKINCFLHVFYYQCQTVKASFVDKINCFLQDADNKWQAFVASIDRIYTDICQGVLDFGYHIHMAFSTPKPIKKLIQILDDMKVEGETQITARTILFEDKATAQKFRKQVYRKISLKYHPDKQQGNKTTAELTELQQQINAANDQLKKWIDSGYEIEGIHKRWCVFSLHPLYLFFLFYGMIFAVVILASVAVWIDATFFLPSPNRVTTTNGNAWNSESDSDSNSDDEEEQVVFESEDVRYPVTGALFSNGTVEQANPVG